ncbi:hypothetical protein BDM02DRAFT_3262832 [Thelephora ganbajun]|uniref:Uncharacterized protein n=1 Tax=Thelephora ganbajun TaxID=370292 RepID=A0ACB6Z8S6_THEGA|nr:hypothetical protein BDM02DRAFT_3262832 [Thelephora ganbajun]
MNTPWEDKARCENRATEQDGSRDCSPAQWKNTHEFDPDRFLDDRVSQYLISNPSIFLPFNQRGSKSLPWTAAFEKINFDTGSNPEAKPPADWVNGAGRKATEKIWVRSHVTIYAQGGVWVRMEEADPERKSEQ